MSNNSANQKKGPKDKNHSGQPAPLSGSHKVKNRQHTRQKNHAHHDM